MSVAAERVAAESAAWIWVPDHAERVETDDYLLVRFPEWFDVDLELLRFEPGRPAAEVAAEVLDRARGFGVAEVSCWVKLGADPSQHELWQGLGGVLDETLDVLALDLAGGVPDLGSWSDGIEVRWVDDVASARDHSEVGRVVFGGDVTPDEQLEKAAAASRREHAEGSGGSVVAYLDGVPAGAAGIAQPADVARLWGGSVLEEARGRGVYRALLDARLRYAVDHRATMSLVKGRVQTSGPILRRAGFDRFGEERSYLVPLR